MRPARAEERCAECGAPRGPGQRYCVGCGSRLAGRDALLAALLARLGEAAGTGTVPANAPPAPTDGVLARRDLRLPAPRVSAVLVLACLAFGAALGFAAASHPSRARSSARAPLKLVFASSATPATVPGAPSEPPASSSEATPTEATPTPPGEPAPTTTPSKPAANSTTPAPPGRAGGGESTGSAPASKLPAFKHVFVVMLSDEPYAAAFGPASAAPYLARTLEHKGELLVRYDAVAHEQLADEVALLSGQGPTAATAANCPSYTELSPSGAAADGQVLGEGCVYPRATSTVFGQLAAKHLLARAYIEGIGEAGGPTSGCAHPSSGVLDPSAGPSPASGPFASFRDPLLYFHALLDSPACASAAAPLGRLRTDLSAPRRTPSLLYISPDRCHDGNPTPCASGAAAGMAAADGFLARTVPEILGSPAYRDGGLLVITVDEAPAGGEFGDSSACCGQPRFPNLAASAPAGSSPRGGGTVGALLLWRSLKGASTSQEPYNHFSLLRTIEDIFGVPHLGYAGLAGVKPFDPSLFTTGG